MEHNGMYSLFLTGLIASLIVIGMGIELWIRFAPYGIIGVVIESALVSYVIASHGREE